LTHAIYLFCILTFLCRLLDKPSLGHWFGYPLMLTSIPLVYLLVKAPQLQRPVLYYVQISLMLGFLLVELLLDYSPKVEFRQVRWMVIMYVTLFFAATGGMLGIARQSGRVWAITAVILFLAMAVLAFVQREVTGM
jgi:peptidoglycan/LPS O-acetylase OafA/YrhL